MLKEVFVHVWILKHPKFFVKKLRVLFGCYILIPEFCRITESIY